MKRLFFCGAAAFTMFCASAETQTYIWNYPVDPDIPDEIVPVYGSMNRVSENGRWAAGGDINDYMGSFIVDTTDPENLIYTADGELYDISNDGVAVGSWYEKTETTRFCRAAIFADGQWLRIDNDERIVGQSYARAISPDGKYIGGMAFCYDTLVEVPDATEDKGRFYPVRWVYNEEYEEYEVDAIYTDIDIPVNQGFIVTDMTSDGSVLCGYVCTCAYTGFLPALIRNDELVMWNHCEIRMEDFYYKGQILGTFPESYIDGVHEDDVWFGVFSYCNDRYVFGCRTEAYDISEDGQEAKYHYYACVYDMLEDKFYDTPGAMTYSYVCGTSPKEVFDNKGNFVRNGVKQSVDNYLSCPNLAIVYDFNAEGTIFAGSRTFYSGASQGYVESPVLAITSTPKVDGIETVTAIDESANVKVAGRTITVEGADHAAIYNASGSLVSNSAQATVAPGIYIVVADGKAAKVAVSR